MDLLKKEAFFLSLQIKLNHVCDLTVKKKFTTTLQCCELHASITSAS